MGEGEELEVSESGLKVFSMEEVEKHTEAKGEDKSIWTVIHDKVYDVTKFLDESDKKGTVDSGPKSWATNSGPSEDSGWSSWIFPVGLALVASIVYRVYFSN